MIRPSIKINVLVLCGLLVGAPAVHANLLANGSFESGNFVNQGNDTMSLAAGSAVISGWKVITDMTAWIGPSNPFGLSASDGSYFLDLTNYQTGAPFAGLTQVITTSPGAIYALSFDLGGSTFWGRPDAIMASAAGTSATFTTSLTGTNNDWYRESMQFVATSTSTTIQFQGVTGSQYIGLDNASVDFISPAPVPEPGTWALMVAGLVSLAAVGRCRAGG